MKDEETIVSCSSLEERWAADSQQRSTHQLSDTCFPCLQGSRLHKSQRKQSVGLLDIHNNNIRRRASSLSLHKCSHMIAAQGRRGDSKTLHCLEPERNTRWRLHFFTKTVWMTGEEFLPFRPLFSLEKHSFPFLLPSLLPKLEEGFIKLSAANIFRWIICQILIFLRKFHHFSGTVTFQTCKDFLAMDFFFPSQRQRYGVN